MVGKRDNESEREIHPNILLYIVNVQRRFGALRACVAWCVVWCV